MQDDAWRRPALNDLDPAREAICMQNTDADYCVEYCPKLGQDAAVVRVFGATENGHSAVAYVHGFLPYFYVPAWVGWTPDELDMFRDALGDCLRERTKTRRQDIKQHVLACTVERKQSIWGYQFGETKDFIKVSVAIPSLVATARGILESGQIRIGDENWKGPFQTYESNVPYALRFMVDDARDTLPNRGRCRLQGRQAPRHGWQVPGNRAVEGLEF